MIGNPRESYVFSDVEDPSTGQAFLNTLPCVHKYMNAHIQLLYTQLPNSNLFNTLLSKDMLDNNPAKLGLILYFA